MHACQANSTRAASTFTATAHQLLQVMVVTVGLISAATEVLGQDGSRAGETPRPATRTSGSAAAQARPASAPPRPDGAAEQAPVKYAEHFVTEMQDQYRTVYVPVIESQTEPARPWWNPLGLSLQTFQPRPIVRWEQRVEKTRVPVQYRELVAETPDALQPAARSTASNGSGTTAAAGRGAAFGVTPNSRPAAALPEPQFGGISRLDSDKPRYGTRPELKPQRVVR